MCKRDLTRRVVFSQLVHRSSCEAVSPVQRKCAPAIGTRRGHRKARNPSDRGRETIQTEDPGPFAPTNRGCNLERLLLAWESRTSSRRDWHGHVGGTYAVDTRFPRWLAPKRADMRILWLTLYPFGVPRSLFSIAGGLVTLSQAMFFPVAGVLATSFLFGSLHEHAHAVDARALNANHGLTIRPK